MHSMSKVIEWVRRYITKPLRALRYQRRQRCLAELSFIAGGPVDERQVFGNVIEKPEE